MKIVKAVLVRRASEDGCISVTDNVPLGKMYRIDLDSLWESRLYNVTKKLFHTKWMVWDIDEGDWFPFVLLEVPKDEIDHPSA